MRDNEKQKGSQIGTVPRSPLIKILSIIDSLLSKIRRKLKKYPFLRKTIKIILSIRAIVAALSGYYQITLAKYMTAKNTLFGLILKGQLDPTSKYSASFRLSLNAIKNILIAKVLFYALPRI